jgi:hypothetical protein
MFASSIKRISILAAVIFVPSFVYCQEKDSSSVADVKSQVPALIEFHEVIYPLWHTAWPEKNIKMLIDLLPEIEKLSSEVIAAKLPGILREKQDAWDNGIKELKSIVQEYKIAAAPIDSQKLLNSAEHLHSQYEKLVRIIRPALKELDAFHAVLYKLYHYYLPEWNFVKIHSTTVELREKMDLLNTAQLSKQKESKKEDFIAARSKLEAAVKELEADIAGCEKKAIADKINAVHIQYLAVEDVLK